MQFDLAYAFATVRKEMVGEDRFNCGKMALALMTLAKKKERRLQVAGTRQRKQREMLALFKQCWCAFIDNSENESCKECGYTTPCQYAMESSSDSD